MNKTPARNSVIRSTGFLTLIGPAALSLLLVVPGCTDSNGSHGLMEGLGAASDIRADPDGVLDKPVPSSSGPWPKLVAEDLHYEFGRMLVGSRKDHTFTIRNEGDAPLELLAGMPTCKCTEFELADTVVAPGESTTLFIQWHGKTRTSAFQHGGPVYTNDPNHESIRFDVSGIVDSALATQPSGNWNAGIVNSEGPVTFDGLVLSHVLPTLTIEDVSAETDLTSVDVEPLDEEELAKNEALSGYRFHVTVSPGNSSGIQKDTITVVTSEVDEALTIPVRASRLGALRLSPARGTRFAPATNTLIMGQFPASQGREAELILVVDQQGGEEEFQLTEIETKPSALKVSLEPIGAPTGVVARYRFRVKVPQGGLRMEHTQKDPATIFCRTNHPTGEEIRLNVAFSTF